MGLSDNRSVVLYGGRVWLRVAATPKSREYFLNADGPYRVLIYPPSEDVVCWQVANCMEPPDLGVRDIAGPRAERLSFLIALHFIQKNESAQAKSVPEMLG